MELQVWPRLCAVCHGAFGAGDGPAAWALSPPAPALAGGLSAVAGQPEALRATILYGRPTRGMPAFGAALDETTLATLLAEVAALVGAPPRPGPLAWPPAAVRAPQPKPAPGTPPILQRLSAVQCGRCHPAVAAEWAASRHALAMGPGVVGQYHGAEALRARCDGCHAPLAEQGATVDPSPWRAPGAAGPASINPLAAEGVTCAACHLRDGTKVGATLALRPSRASPGVVVVRDARLSRSEACLPCHQLAPPAASAGAPPDAPRAAPLLDTWREWAASPYLPAEVHCQHCHLPGGDHRMTGVHDPETVRRAVTLEVVRWALGDAEVVLTAALHNVGAGHHFPTTATPRAVLQVVQLGADAPLDETQATWAIGRTLTPQPEPNGALGTVADTRIPAGARSERQYRWRRHPQAEAVEVSLWMFPDWHYARVFAGATARPGLAPAVAFDLGQARAEAQASGFKVWTQRLSLPPRGRPAQRGSAASVGSVGPAGALR